MAIKKKHKATIIRRYMTLILIGVSLVFYLLLMFINVLPFKFMIIIFVVIALTDLFMIKKLLHRNKKYKGWPLIVVLFLILGYFIGTIYAFTTASFLSRLGLCDIKTYNYVVMTLNKNNYSKIKDLRDKDIVYLSTDEDTISEVNKKTKNEVIVKDNIDDTLNEIINKKCDAIIIEQSFYDILKEENNSNVESLKIIDKFSISIKKRINKDEVDIAKAPFNVLITGIDTTGSVNSVARSDVNILASINPKTHQIALTAVPRDYYVEIKKGEIPDKLTHSGIYGVDSTIYAMENLLDVDINYYVKVNFSSVVNIIDVIGDVTVVSDVDFRTGTYDFNERSYYFKQGENVVDGKKALAFARERKAFSDGDRRRGVHQMELIRAMTDKVLEPSILIKYNSLLKELEESFVTNIGHDNISKLIKKQIDNNEPWEFINISVTGTDSYEKTYSYRNQKSYCMLPDKDSVNNAKKQIKIVLNK